MSTRDEFFVRVRQAVAEGNRAGTTHNLPSRGRLGYQGAGIDRVECFRATLTAAGGTAHVTKDKASAAETVLRLVEERSAHTILLENNALLERLPIKEALQRRGLQVRAIDELSPESSRDAFFAADIGITSVRYLIAETGTLVMACERGDPRSASLLPPVHIAVAQRKQLLDDLFDLFDILGAQSLPSCLTLITGPSKTGDIELKLVTGVHGPGELHVVLIDN